jgi:hypothetical protein
LAVNQTITIRDITIIPDYGMSGQGFFTYAIGIDEANGAVGLTGATVNFENVTVTSAGPGNVANDPTVAPPANAKHILAAVGFYSNPAGSNSTTTYNFTNCRLCHMRNFWSTAGADVIELYCDGPTVNLNSCLLAYAYGAVSGTALIYGSSANGSIVNLNNCICRNSDYYGIFGDGSATGRNTINLNAGTQVYSNGYYGVGHFSNDYATYTFNGTPAAPVIIRNSGNRGFASRAGTNRVGNTQHLICASNGYAFEMNEVDHQAGVGPISSCIFSGNATANFRVGDTNTVAAGVSVTSCTFHNPSGTGTNVLFNYSGTTLLTYTFTDCIFSGAGDTALDCSAGAASNIFNLVNCARAKYGANALAATDIVPGTATVTTTSNIDADPVYSSTTFGAANYMAVRNGSNSPDGYANARVNGTALMGGATYIGDARVKAITSVPQSATLHGATLDATAAVSTPFEWIVYLVAADPNSVGSAGIRAVRDTTQYWDISPYPTSAAPTADITLSWADGIAGFNDTTGRIYHYSGTAWDLAGTFSSIDTSGDPNTVKQTGITTFSPFSIGDSGSVPVTISGLSIE